MSSSQRRLLFIVCLQAFFNGFEAAGLQQILQKIGASFHATQTLLGGLIALQYLAMMVMPALLGRPTDRYGKKRTALFACGAYAAGCALILAAGGPVCLGAGIFLCGTGYGVSESVGIAALYDLFPGAAARRIAFSQALFSLGGIVSPLLLERLMGGGGPDWRVLFYILTAVNLLMAVPVLLCYPAPAPRPEAAAERLSAKELRGLLTPAILLLIVSIFAASGVENGFAYYVDLYAMEVLDSPDLTARTLSLFWTVNVAMRLVNSAMPRLGRGMLYVCYGITAAALGAMAAFPGPLVFMAGSAALGGALAPMWPLIQSLAMAEAPDRTATVSGVMSVPCGAGAVLFLSLSGRLADGFGVRAIYFVLALLALAGLLTFSVYARRKTRAG